MIKKYITSLVVLVLPISVMAVDSTTHGNSSAGAELRDLRNQVTNEEILLAMRKSQLQSYIKFSNDPYVKTTKEDTARGVSERNNEIRIIEDNIKNLNTKIGQLGQSNPNQKATTPKSKKLSFCPVTAERGVWQKVTGAAERTLNKFLGNTTISRERGTKIEEAPDLFKSKANQLKEAIDEDCGEQPKNDPPKTPGTGLTLEDAEKKLEEVDAKGKKATVAEKLAAYQSYINAKLDSGLEITSGEQARLQKLTKDLEKANKPWWKFW